MRLPRECYQMLRSLKPFASPQPVTGRAGLVGVRDYPGRERLPECRRRRSLHQGKLGQSPAAAFGRWLYDGGDRSRPWMMPLLRSRILKMGPPWWRLGLGPRVERARHHRHRHQRGLPELRDSRGLAHPARQPSQKHDRDCAVRPGTGQSEIVETDTRSGLASLHEVSRKTSLSALRNGRRQLPEQRLRSPSGYRVDRERDGEFSPP